MGVNGIYGLSGSGMDIESMVKVGMMSKQNEYDKMAQKFTKNEWLKADYLELSNSITTFNTSTLSQYKMSTTMNAKGAESSNSSAVRATATSSATPMSHKVEILGQSSNAYLVGTNHLTRYDTTTGTAYSSTDTGSTSIQLKDVLFSQLQKNGDKYYGTIATVDLDMEGTSRDRTDTTSADGVALDEVAKFGYTSNAAHWEKNGEYYEPTDEDLFAAYKQDNNSKLEGYGWRYWHNETNDTYHWQKYTPENAGISTVWPTYSNPENSAYADSFKTFLANKESETGLSRYTAGEKDYVTSAGGVAADATAFKFTLSDGSTTDSSDQIKEVEIKFTYEELSNGATFNDLVTKINNSGLNIRATYDSVHDTFSLYNTQSGDANGIQIGLGEDEGYGTSRSALTTRNFLNNLGLYQSKAGELYGQDSTGTSVSTDETEATTLLFTMSNSSTSTTGVNSFKGENGGIKIDGVTYSDVVDNKITVNGVNYTILDGTAGTKATVTVTQDTDAIIDKVKSFITDYNKLLSSLYEKYDEKSDSNYKPLTQSQKDAMKEEQITKWEEKAKKGLLYHDQTIGKIIQNMRSSITDSIELEDGSKVSVFSLGISTTGLKGQLTLDEDKLKAALAKDPDVVYNVFAKLDSNDLDNKDKMGVAQRLSDVFVAANKSIKTRAGSSSDITEDSDLNNLLRQLQTKMSNFKKLMNSFEDALYKKYDAMESTLAKLGTQLNYIMGGNS